MSLMIRDSFTATVEATGQRISVIASYRVDDPWAVHLTLGSSPAVEWTIARQLLTEFLLVGTAGEGDVILSSRQVATPTALKGYPACRLTLRPGTQQQMSLLFPRLVLSTFHDRTTFVVPLGSERDHAGDLDAELQAMLHKPGEDNPA